jgi:hypothetical protein
MPVPTPAEITEPFGSSALAGNITLPIPVPTQAPANPGRASFTDGFPPPNFLNTGAGGIPPSGKDFNGLLYMITAYLAAYQAGQFSAYSPTTEAAIGGYALGAILAQASGKGFWLNLVADNATDPDTGGAGWAPIVPTPTGAVSDGPSAGAHNNYAPTGYGQSTGFLEVTPAANANITGIAAGADGQQLIVTNLSASFTLTLNALNAGSLAANRLRMPGDITLVQNNSIRFVYSAAIGLWVQS